MKNMLKHPVASVGLVLGVAAVVAAILWNTLDLGTVLSIHNNVDDLANGRNLPVARSELKKTPRGPTIEALKEALDEEDGTPVGKYQVLLLLNEFKESRAVARAIESSVLSTQRGAAYFSQNPKGDSARACEIAIKWLDDKGAADRRLAILILRANNRREVIPQLKQIIENEGTNAQSAAEVIRAIDALNHMQAEGIGPLILKLASNKSIDARVRAEAFRVLTNREDTPRDELRALLTDIAKDKKAPSSMRSNAVLTLGMPANANEEVWELLKSILLDPDEPNEIFQRSALDALRRSYPLDKLAGLILDRRVYGHRFFGVRTDVATAIGNLRIESRLALDVLTEMLVDDDPRDYTDNVPRQAWLSWWLLSGLTYGASHPERFRRVPLKIQNEDDLRFYLFAIQHANVPTISVAQVRALEGFTMGMEDIKLRNTAPKEYQRLKAAKFAECKKIHDVYRAKIDSTIDKWKEKAAKEKKD